MTANGGSAPAQGVLPRQAEAPPTPGLAPPGTRVGTVRVIGAGSRFVLLETVSPGSAAGILDGQELRCTRANPLDAAGPSAIVKVSRERRPPFIVADVLSGEPQAGDDVYALKGPAAAPLSASTPSATSFLLPAAARPPAAATPH